MSPAPIEGFLLSAGLGTRMGPLSGVLPKPAWTLRGLPLLQWGARSLRAAGIEALACNAHLHPERLREAAAGLEVFEEPRLLGSAGGLLHVRGRVPSCLLVWNADAVGEVPWRLLRSRHLELGAQLTWLLVPHPGGPWSRVWLDEGGRVLRKGETGRGPFLFTGASAWSPEALGMLSEGPSEARDLLPRLDSHIGCVVEHVPWWEVGTPDQLIAAARDLAPAQEGRVSGCYVHPGAEPTGRLQRCVLGPGASPPPALEDRDAFWFAEKGRQVRVAM